MSPSPHLKTETHSVSETFSLSIKNLEFSELHRRFQGTVPLIHNMLGTCCTKVNVSLGVGYTVHSAQLFSFVI
jgi:hypothetical protein